MSGSDRLVKLAEVADPAAAHVYAALLDSAGISVELYGEALGPYVIAMGAWAVTELWVPESAWEEAVEILTAAGPQPELTVLGAREPSGSVAPPAWFVPVAIAGAVSLVALWLVASRF